MNLNRLLMRRTAWLLVAGFALLWMLATWRARVDVSGEEQGARNAAELMAHLYGLQTLPASRLPQEIATLRALAAGLRHFTFRLEDAQGRFIVGRTSPQAEEDTGFDRWLRTLMPYDGSERPQTWMVRRADGRDFRVVLLDNPWSERVEAWRNMRGLFAMFLLYSVVLWLCLYLTVRYAFAPIRSILATIGRWERQDFAPRLPPMRIEELQKIAQALNRLVEAVIRSRDEQRQLLLKLQTLQEDERARLARELHDDFAQTVTAIHADATWLRMKLRRPEAAPVLGDLEARCTDLQTQMRQVLRQLRPGAGAQGEAPLPLAQLLRQLVQDWGRLPGQEVDCQCDFDVDGSAVPRSLALAIYRLTQEALTNIARHARARQVLLTLRARAQAPILWSVQDDGVGIADVDRAMQRGNGLAGMRERAWAHGGNLRVYAGPGVCLTASFPWPQAGLGA